VRSERPEFTDCHSAQKATGPFPLEGGLWALQVWLLMLALRWSWDVLERPSWQPSAGSTVRVAGPPAQAFDLAQPAQIFSASATSFWPASTLQAPLRNDLLSFFFSFSATGALSCAAHRFVTSAVISSSQLS
jgi:hypothetical protein